MCLTSDLGKTELPKDAAISVHKLRVCGETFLRCLEYIMTLAYACGMELAVASRFYGFGICLTQPCEECFCMSATCYLSHEWLNFEGYDRHVALG